MNAERTDPAAISRALAALLRAQDDIARALAAIRALDRTDPDPNRTAPDPAVGPDAPPIAVLVDDDVATVPCPTPDVYRAHQIYHYQTSAGWRCRACDALAPSRTPTAARP